MRERQEWCRKRKLRDVSHLQELGAVVFERKNPRPPRETRVLTLSEVKFATWVMCMKAWPKSSETLLGKEEFVFKDRAWREVDVAFRRLQQMNTRE